MTAAPVAPASEEVSAVLDHYGTLTRTEMERHIAADWSEAYLRAPVIDYPRRGGKSLRPALLLATCEAFGGIVHEGMPSAVALEMLHNAFLIHDDLEDHSVLRRGEPALHHRYGRALAINAGDALALAGMGALRANVDRLGPRLAQRVVDEFDFMARHTADGQALDLGWRIDNRMDLTPDDYMQLIMKKTCWYTTILPLRVGAMIGSRGGARLGPMIDFGFHLGAAFQIHDDILNMTADPGVYGKERYGDIREGKRTLMLIHVLAEARRDERRRLESFLGLPEDQRTEADVAGVAALMEDHGSVSFAIDFAEGVARSAEEAFERAFSGVPVGRHRRFIRDLIDFMIKRDR